jgi:hypothetical protein
LACACDGDFDAALLFNPASRDAHITDDFGKEPQVIALEKAKIEKEAHGDSRASIQVIAAPTIRFTLP